MAALANFDPTRRYSQAAMNRQHEILAKPRFSVADAEAIAQQHFGFSASAMELNGERDQNFLLAGQQGQSVLKIANGQCKLNLLELENAAIGIVAGLDSIESPTLHKSISGSTIVSVADESGQNCFARMLSHVPGVPLAEFRPHSQELFTALGRALGEIDIELDSLSSHRSARRELQWDLANGGTVVSESLQLFANDQEKMQQLQIVLGWHEQIAGRLADLPHSVIHNDANDYNILVYQEPNSKLALIGLIDFGDIVYSRTINELAICAAYAMLDKSHPIEVAKALVGGYHQARRLSEDELSVLFPLICLRLAQSVSLSAAQHLMRPEDEYLTITEASAWATLRMLTRLNPRDIHLGFSDACSTIAQNRVARQTPAQLDDTQILSERRRYVAPSLSLSYDRPLQIVRGHGQYLFDSADMTYLDCVNNVCHVGHCHPEIVRAASEQMELLNTNTRYLHENIVRYAKRLTETLPEPLEVCFLLNSGSEANDLALRLARTKTGQHDVLVIERAYHGHTSAMIEISPYKFSRAGGNGKPAHVHVLSCPDGYRGKYSYADDQYGQKYVADAQQQIADVVQSGRSIAGFFAEPLQGCGGQISLPKGYLSGVFEEVRAHGGVCITDEVQVGFGRLGSSFWGFQQQSVIPDIVTMGKPIGNGHPLAAVVTTREIANAFNNGMEYFNTFGGNPVSSAVGLAVLDVIEKEGLQQHAFEIGTYLLDNLRELQQRYPVIGDVRGSGLFLGIELVEAKDPAKPATELAHRFVERMKERRILLSFDGPDNNVIKFKPPMVFNRADAERLIATMEREFEQLL